MKLGIIVLYILIGLMSHEPIITAGALISSAIFGVGAIIVERNEEE